MNNNNNHLSWKAFSDSTRRTILDLIKEQPRTTSYLCEYFKGLSRFAVMKHLGILHDADLVIVKREGKFRWNFINTAPIQEIYERWMSKYTIPLAASVSNLKQHIEQEKKGEISMTNKEQSLTQVSSTQVELKIDIKASKQRVWQAITEEIGTWWRKDFYVYENAKLVFEAYPGGRLYEDAGEKGGGVWYTVLNISPPNQLQLVGHLAPQYGGPATTILQLTLEEANGSTTLHVSDALFGRLSNETQSQVSEGWRLLFEEGLKPYVEGHS